MFNHIKYPKTKMSKEEQAIFIALLLGLLFAFVLFITIGMHVAAR